MSAAGGLPKFRHEPLNDRIAPVAVVPGPRRHANVDVRPDAAIVAHMSAAPDGFCVLKVTVVAMGACGGSHYWGREVSKLGTQVRLIPPAYKHATGLSRARAVIRRACLWRVSRVRVGTDAATQAEDGGHCGLCHKMARVVWAVLAKGGNTPLQPCRRKWLARA